MVDKITTVKMEKPGQRIGALSSSDMQATDLSLATLLGLRKTTVPSIG
jgi:mRNA-degrading endonuclease toxin of MazEF toxin-antitoxin module